MRSAPLRTIALVALLLLAPALQAQSPAAAVELPSDKVRSTLDQLLPEGVDISELGVSGGRATLSGVAVDTVQLSQFIRRIGDAPEFEAPTLEQVSNVDGMSAFTLTTDVKCPREAVPYSLLCGTAAAATKTQTVFKCLINGTLTFQGHPCPAGKDAPVDPNADPADAPVVFQP